MIVFITGGSASGKSEYAGMLAEQQAEKNRTDLRCGRCGSCGGEILYVATMKDRSPESVRKIERHRRLRDRGNYEVAECFSLQDLEGLICGKQSPCGQSGISSEYPVYAAVLFDSLDGFTADVFFDLEEVERESSEWLAEKTAEGILGLQSIAECVIIVSDEMGSDGIQYDEVTEKYMYYTAVSERLIAESADVAVEVVCGIPLMLKGETNEFF